MSCMIRSLKAARSRVADLLVAFACLALLGACAQTPPSRADATPPKNIIILFGDGAAATQWELGRLANRELRKRPFAVTDIVFRQGTMGLVTTHSASSPVTDSAAAASAMSTGHKTLNDMTGVNAEGKP